MVVLGLQRVAVVLCPRRLVMVMGPQRQVAVMELQRPVVPRTRWWMKVAQRRRRTVPHGSPVERMAVHGRPRAAWGRAELRLRTGTMQSPT